ncbi:MAG: sodium:solute symporter family protein [Myxococcota bacterium]
MSAGWTIALGATLIVFVCAMFGLSLAVRDKVNSVDDFVVAGRRLPFWLAMPGLFATWFGAGTLLTATDEVRAGGLKLIALEPLGSGLCLVVAGFFFAERLWNMKLLTIIDFYRLRFGVRAEFLAGLLMVPGYLGWIAAQFIALAELLELFFGLPVMSGIVLVAALGTAYTLIGGMWSVTLTDAVQVALLVIGLVILGINVVSALGEGDWLAGTQRLWNSIPTHQRVVFPTETLSEAVRWLTLLAVASLGNIPAQDLTQRIFASESSTTARRACTAAGMAYIVFGMLPVLIGLGTAALVPSPEGSALAAIASAYMHPATLIVFLLAIFAAVLSTIDSALLSPATVLAQNIAPKIPALARREIDGLVLNRWMVGLVTLLSLVLAFSGASAFELLESAYAAGLVALLVPLAIGLYSRAGDESAALGAMLVATGVWSAHLAVGAEDFLGQSPLMPATLASTLIGALVYVLFATFKRTQSDDTSREFD